jgi:tRNA(fMet)-specific endonuclease VapC
MTRYMLDTNALGHFIRQQPNIVRHILAIPMASLCISAITEGELLFGLARRPQARKLHLAVHEVLRRVDVLLWDRDAARHYGPLRAALEQAGKILGPLDMLIAAHALAAKTILISNDKVFAHVPGLTTDDWTNA